METLKQSWWNSRTPHGVTVKHLMVEHWKNHGGTVKDLMVKQ